MEAPGFWDDAEKAQGLMRELKGLKDDIEGYAALQQGYEDIQTLLEMAYEENDPEMIPEIGERSGFLLYLRVLMTETTPS